MRRTGRTPRHGEGEKGFSAELERESERCRSNSEGKLHREGVGSAPDGAWSPPHRQRETRGDRDSRDGDREKDRVRTPRGTQLGFCASQFKALVYLFSLDVDARRAGAGRAAGPVRPRSTVPGGSQPLVRRFPALSASGKEQFCFV